MRIVIVGAGGFIGSRITIALRSRGHEIVCAGRNPTRLSQRFPACEAIHADLATDDADTWQPRLTGADAVINAAGQLRGDLGTIHHRGPVALFDACASARIPHVLQISALGAGAQPDSRFLATKHEADRHLLRLAQHHGLRGWSVLRPSLVIGRGGASTQLFSSLAAAPRPIRLASGAWPVQPIHVADLAAAIATLVEQPGLPPVIDLVGPTPMTTDDLTAALRTWLNLPPRPSITIPLPVMRAAARLGDLLPTAALTTESLQMLARGNTADPQPLTTALGWHPKPLQDALAAEPSVAADLWHARLLPIRGTIRAALAAVWIGSGIASFALPPGRAQALLAHLTTNRFQAITLTWAGAAIDLALGLALLIRPWRRRALQGQLAIMLAYTVLATLALPRLWLDPFGPLLKNLAVLAATLSLLAIEG